jgi:predicted secreted hydrolase
MCQGLARLAALTLATVLLAGCGPILAVAPAERPTSPPEPSTPPRPADPVPIALPRDDGPHDRLTEWWYYTGHLRGERGGRWGFEFVVFRAERGVVPVAWASHLALTDELGERFIYEERSHVGVGVDRSKAGGGFDLTIPDDASTSEAAGEPWRMAGAGGHDTLTASFRDGLGFDLELTSLQPPALHDTDGWIDFGPAGGSYYYSRTRMAVDGSLTVEGADVPTVGLTWFDHQWGDFISVGGGGWDWFAVNLEDGTDLSLSLVRDRAGNYPLVYGTLVAPDGDVRHLTAAEFDVKTTGRWRSPDTGADYPAGWKIDVPGEGLAIDLLPTVADQELDTRDSTGVVYWEGSQRVSATRDGRSVRGEAYVELTGYAG